MKRRIAVLMILIVAALVVALLATASLAQGPGRNATPSERTGALKALGLTQDQIQQIHSILQQYRTDVAAVLKSTATREEKKAQIEPLKTTAAGAIAAVLTPDQLAAAKQKGIIGRLLNRTTVAQAGIMVMLKRLNLTEDQKAQVKTILDERKAKAQAIKGDTTLSPDQRKAALTELRKDTHEKIKAILTPEQQQKLEQMMRNRGQRQRRGK